MDEATWLSSEDPQAMLHALLTPWELKLSTGGAVPQCDAQPSDRKLRLWASAACREAFKLTGGPTPASVQLCDLSDRYADGLIPYSELEAFKPSHPDCSWPLRYDKNIHTTILNTINMKVFLPGQANLLREIIGNPFRPVRLLRTPVDRMGYCQCDCATSCPLGRTGMESRCGPEDFRAGGVIMAHWWLTPQVLSIATAAYEERPGRKCDECKGSGETDWWGDDDMRIDHKCPTCHGTGRIADGSLDPVTLSVLADALEDAGCDNEDILRHLRGCERCPHRGRNQLQSAPDIELEYWDDDCPLCNATGWRRLPGPHVRGCWSLDCLLGKE